MDKAILLEALNDLDPELVEEGAAPRRRPGRRALILAAALAAAVCIMGATGVLERALLMTGVGIGLDAIQGELEALLPEPRDPLPF